MERVVNIQQLWKEGKVGLLRIGDEIQLVIAQEVSCALTRGSKLLQHDAEFGVVVYSFGLMEFPLQQQTQQPATETTGPKKLEAKIQTIALEGNFTVFEAIVGNQVFRTKAFPGRLTIETARRNWENPFTSSMFKLIDPKQLEEEKKQAEKAKEPVHYTPGDQNKPRRSNNKTKAKKGR